MKKLLWVGDAGCPSGFALSTHRILDTLRHEYDVTVLGINYRGDPHGYPYPIYAAEPGGDAFGVGRLIWMCDLVKPDVIVLQNDPWNIPMYTRQLKRFKEYADIPVVGIVAVDGKNCMGKGLNDLSLAIFWTQFGLDEARKGGFKGEAAVIPLGVDLDVYYQIDKLSARAKKLPREFQLQDGRKVASDDAFIVGNVNRNQPRKRWDLTVRYFADWVKTHKVEDAYLFLHTAPTGDMGCDVQDLARYYGMIEHLLLVQPETWYGVSEAEMRETYNCFDVQISTTQGEGFGLTTFEGMACGVPQIVPRWASLGELTGGAAWQVECSATAVGPPYVNVLGGVADQDEFVEALQALYFDQSMRDHYRNAGLQRVNESCFRWENIGKAFADRLATLPARVEKVA